MSIVSGRRNSGAGTPHSAKKSHRPTGATMLSTRAGSSPSTSKLCGVERGTSANPRGPWIVRASLDPAGTTTRPARRRGYFAALLEPLELPPATHERLAAALTLLFGIDPIVALTDNGDIERERIPDVLAWTARRLVEAALAEAGHE
jgi:hypothetical protein